MLLYQGGKPTKQTTNKQLVACCTEESNEWPIPFCYIMKGAYIKFSNIVCGVYILDLNLLALSMQSGWRYCFIVHAVDISPNNN